MKDEIVTDDIIFVYFTCGLSGSIIYKDFRITNKQIVQISTDGFLDQVHPIYKVKKKWGNIFNLKRKSKKKNVVII